ncbi:hypothetical protein SKAU_G00351200 [Synaphobranchus kaupii]|uniref:Uncharacterized protein n=1 Tax=Synaphobranchus kaupii TaxID=118154 RepID=A0A9Q1IHY7_SYNKA|nr:hypothetical protein SKAU_G00351200 [Synaphobranchus kaupii]
MYDIQCPELHWCPTPNPGLRQVSYGLQRGTALPPEAARVRGDPSGERTAEAAISPHCRRGELERSAPPLARSMTLHPPKRRPERRRYTAAAHSTPAGPCSPPDPRLAMP